MGKIVCRYETNEPIKKLVERMGLLRDNAQSRMEFLSRQKKKLEAETRADAKSIWDQLSKEIDTQKLLEPGEVSENINMTIDEEVGCIRRAEMPQFPFSAQQLSF